MRSIEIEQITIPYDTELLLKWKARDESIVPSFMLDWNGPGINNGMALESGWPDDILKIKAIMYLSMNLTYCPQKVSSGDTMK